MRIHSPAVLIFSAVLGFAPALSWGESPVLGRHAEYQIPSSWLIAFSSEGVRARLCSSCSVTSWSSVDHTEWKEYTNNIDVDRATELYVSKESFDVIYLGLDREEGKLDYIDFGGYVGDN